MTKLISKCQSPSGPLYYYNRNNVPGMSSTNSSTTSVDYWLTPEGLIKAKQILAEAERLREILERQRLRALLVQTKDNLRLITQAVKDKKAHDDQVAYFNQTMLAPMGVPYTENHSKEAALGAGLIFNGLMWGLDPVGMAAYTAVENSPRVFNSNETVSEYADRELDINPLVTGLATYGFGRGTPRLVKRGFTAIDNTARAISPMYDLSRTIGETKLPFELSRTPLRNQRFIVDGLDYTGKLKFIIDNWREAAEKGNTAKRLRMIDRWWEEKAPDNFSDSGQLIDITKRFDFKNPDIRDASLIVPLSTISFDNALKINNLTSHLLGEDAVRMFKEYGGEKWPEGSINGELLMKYVPEARERYGLVGNINITDEEIAQALYKHIKELGGNTKAVNALGEPLLLFRGDTQSYTKLKPRMTPEELATKRGTMDNSLGTLFLGEFPNNYLGADRYLGTWRMFNGNISLEPSGTGSKVLSNIDPENLPKGSYELYSALIGRRLIPIRVVKLPGSAMESGVNDLNAFVVRTPNVRDATPEISVLNDDWLAKGAHGTTPHMKTKYIEDESGFPLFLHPDGTTTPALAGYDNRPGMAEHYRYVLDDAEANNQGLLKSDIGAPLRDEHSLYTYFALPNFNIQGAKHILPFDLRIPRNWKNPNIYKTIAGFTTLGTIGTSSNK